MRREVDRSVLGLPYRRPGACKVEGLDRPGCGYGSSKPVPRGAGKITPGGLAHTGLRLPPTSTRRSASGTDRHDGGPRAVPGGRGDRGPRRRRARRGGRRATDAWWARASRASPASARGCCASPSTPTGAGAGIGSALLRALEERLLRMGVHAHRGAAARGRRGPRGLPAPGLRAHPGGGVLREARAAAPRRPRRARGHGRPPHRAHSPGTSWTGWRTPRSSSSGGSSCRWPSRTSPSATASSRRRRWCCSGPRHRARRPSPRPSPAASAGPSSSSSPAASRPRAAHGRAGALRDFFDAVYDIEHLVAVHRRGRRDRRARGRQRPDTEGVTNELLKAIPLVPRARRPPARLRDQLGARPRPRPCCAPGASTTSCRSARPTTAPAGRSGGGFLAGHHRRAGAPSTTWSRSPSCSPRPTSSSPRARPPRRPSSAPSPRAPTRPPRTEDFRAAVAATRPTLTRAMVREFEEDIERFARL